MNLKGYRAYQFLLLCMIPHIAAAQFELDAVEGRRRSGDAPDDRVFSAAKTFMQTHSRSASWKKATMSISVPRLSPRVWDVLLDRDFLVSVEPATARVLTYGDLAYRNADRTVRDQGGLAIRSEREAIVAGEERLARLLDGMDFRIREVEYTRDGEGTWGSVWAEATILRDGIPVSLPAYVELDLASGAVVLFQGPRAHTFESTDARLNAVEGVSRATDAYAGMKIFGERGQYDPTKPPEKIYIKPRSQYGLAYPPTEEVVRLRLAWRVRFGHHVVDVDAATGQILGESLGKE